jgi:hypothetical protein
MGGGLGELQHDRRREALDERQTVAQRHRFDDGSVFIDQAGSRERVHGGRAASRGDVAAGLARQSRDLVGEVPAGHA